MKIQFSPNKAGGEIFSYHFQIKRGEGHWWGVEFLNADEMREAARALVEMADKLDKEKGLDNG